MANYCCVTRTNDFRVTDEKKYQELFKGICTEGDIYDFTEADENGQVLHGFGAYGPIDYFEVNDEKCKGCGFYDECSHDADDRHPCCEKSPDNDIFYNGLQKILPEGEVFTLFEAGNEKLRYVGGYAVAVAKGDIRTFTLDSWANGFISEQREVLEKKRAEAAAEGSSGTGTGSHEQKGSMTLERAKELLNRVIDHESAGRNCRDTIRHLLWLGFTGEELHSEFGFSLFDVADMEEEEDEDDEDNAVRRKT